MFNINDTVMHPGAGVCRIIQIKTETFEKQPRTYYVLTPVYESMQTKIFVPVDAERIVLRPLLTKAEIDALLQTAETVPLPRYGSEKERTEKFTDIVNSGNHAHLLSVIGVLLREKQAKEAQKKKLRACDERLLTQAQSLIDREFSYTLGLDLNATAQYIRNAIQASST